MTTLIQPYKGTLVDLFAPQARTAALKEQALSMPSWDLTFPQLGELELLKSGGFSPLRGYLGQADYERVLAEWRLQDGTFWPMPLTLDISAAVAEQLEVGASLALRDLEGVLLAVVKVGELWAPDRAAEAQALYGSTDSAHPGVARVLAKSGTVCVGGVVEGVESRSHHSFVALRHAPAELRAQFAKRGWTKVAAFHTRAPIHVAQQKLAQREASELGASLLLHPLIEDGEDYYHRVRCYRAALEHFPRQTTLLSLQALPARPAGAREVLWHAIVRQNCGCSHMLWEQGGAGSYDADAEALAQYSEQLDIELRACAPYVYVEERAAYLPPAEVPADARIRPFDEQELQRRLREGTEIPEWFTFPGVERELRMRYPANSELGFTLFFTGLSGSGKSTIAKAVQAKLLELGGRPVTLLDGDEVRKHLSSELGFSKEHRNINIRRIGYVASEITKNSGIAICAPIAPYAALRSEVRAMIEPYGGFIEIHVATPLEECERRDRKGLYAKARAGIIKEFTGISDPYEEPQTPELRIDTTGLGVDEVAQQVFLYLEQHGYIT